MFSHTAKPVAKENSDLFGILQIGGQRHFSISFEDEIFLMSKTFWTEKNLCIPFSKKGAIFLEKFKVSSNNQFLEKVQNNFLIIELSKNKQDIEIIGYLRLPLHQFFIAYRDASLMKRLNDSQLPVTSVNAWMPVFDSKNNCEQIGEIECLLAMGTEKQIENVESLKNSPSCLNKTETINFHETSCHNLEKNIGQHESDFPTNMTRKTSDLFNMLQKSLVSKTNAGHVLPDLKLTDRNVFRLHLEIKSARNLPWNQSLKQTKKLNRSAGAKGCHNTKAQTGEYPSTYVTFLAEKEENSLMVKSHEGMVCSTLVIKNNCNPVWNTRFSISLSVKYLVNKKEKLILKVWKKSSKSLTHMKQCSHPNPMEDAIIGFASIDLSKLVGEESELNEWFDIFDFNGYVNGQIYVVAKLVEDIKNVKDNVCTTQVDNLLNNFETSLDISNMNLCRAIKRKFTELEEISERLKARLLDVTDNLDGSQDFSDKELNEFEHDLDTAVTEDEDFTLQLKSSPSSSRMK